MAPGLRHELLLHSGRVDLVRQAVAFLSEGAALGEPGLLLAGSRSCREVRAGLGAAAQWVTFVDAAVVAHNPARVLSIVRDATALGGPARAIASPNAHVRTQERDEIVLHEHALNLPTCRSWDVWLQCPYDTRVISARSRAALAAAHPRPEGIDASADQAARLFATPLPAPPADAYRLATPGDLAATRRAVREWASGAGLDPGRCDDLVVAVNEASTNAIRHGSGTGEVLMWTTGSDVVCEVRDEAGFADVLAGRLAPPAGRASGRGLWLVNQLCDLVQVRSPVGGTSVRMTMHLNGPVGSC